MKLEVGKTYEVRDTEECKRIGSPTRVKIMKEVSRGIFKGNDGDVYFSDGFLNCTLPCPYDLVKEVTTNQ